MPDIVVSGIDGGTSSSGMLEMVEAEHIHYCERVLKWLCVFDFWKKGGNEPPNERECVYGKRDSKAIWKDFTGFTTGTGRINFNQSFKLWSTQ